LLLSCLLISPVLAMESSFATSLSGATIGFLGCGKISTALCRGMAGLSDIARPKCILVSRRSVDKSGQLARESPLLIEVLDSNEDIVERADVVFIGLLPSVAREELPKLDFTSRKLVISMMAAVNYDETRLLTRILGDGLVRIVPLPSAARRSGPIVMFPPNPVAENLLKHIGTPVACATEVQMKPMISITGHISSFFELMRTSQTFLSNHGAFLYINLTQYYLTICCRY
jgi:pyrroline-5-carboxylate reductase